MDVIAYPCLIVLAVAFGISRKPCNCVIEATLKIMDN